VGGEKRTQKEGGGEILPTQEEGAGLLSPIQPEGRGVVGEGATLQIASCVYGPTYVYRRNWKSGVRRPTVPNPRGKKKVRALLAGWEGEKNGE